MAGEARQVVPLLDMENAINGEFERNTYRLTDAQRIEIIRLYRNGVSQWIISRRLRISSSTVTRWIRRYENEKNLRVKNSTGRPPLSNEQENFQLACSGETKMMLYLCFILLFKVALILYRSN